MQEDNQNKRPSLFSLNTQSQVSKNISVQMPTTQSLSNLSISSKSYDTQNQISQKQQFEISKKPFSLTSESSQLKDRLGGHYGILALQSISGQSESAVVVHRAASKQDMALFSLLQDKTGKDGLARRGSKILSGRQIVFSQSPSLESAKLQLELFSNPEIHPDLDSLFFAPAIVTSHKKDTHSNSSQSRVHVFSILPLRAKSLLDSSVSELLSNKQTRLSLVCNLIERLEKLHRVHGLKAGDVSGHNLAIYHDSSIKFRSASQLEGIIHPSEGMDEMLLLLCQLKDMKVINNSELVAFLSYYLRLHPSTSQNCAACLDITQNQISEFSYQERLIKALSDRANRFYGRYYSDN